MSTPKAMSTPNTHTQATGLVGALMFVGCSILVMIVLPLLLLFAWAGFAPFAAFLFIVIAVIKTRPLRRADGTVVALYWLGTAHLIGWSAFAIVYLWGLSFRPRGYEALAWFTWACWAAAATTVGTAALLAVVRRRVLGGTEVAIYWLGSVAALAWAVFWLLNLLYWREGPVDPNAERYGVHAGAALIVASAVALALLRLRSLGDVELATYAIGSAVAIGLSAGMFYESPTVAIIVALSLSFVGLLVVASLRARRSSGHVGATAAGADGGT